MTKKLAFFLILILSLLFNCENEQSELEFEKSVAYEIFPALMDSLHYDSRLKLPPPPKAIYDEQGKYIGIDTTEAEHLIADYHKRRAELKADSVKLIIAINDSTSRLGVISKSNLTGHFYKQELKLDTLNITESYKIDLNRLNANKKLQFRYRSELPNGRDLWRKKDSFNINATTWITRIQFDLTKTYGVLESGISCGIYCGRAVRVFIRNKNGNWIIDKIVDYGEVI
jgi:hypothetical protein